MVNLDPITKSDFCAYVRVEEDRFTTHLAMMLSGYDVHILVEVVANALVVVVFLWLLGLSGH